MTSRKLAHRMIILANPQRTDKILSFDPLAGCMLLFAQPASFSFLPPKG